LTHRCSLQKTAQQVIRSEIVVSLVTSASPVSDQQLSHRGVVNAIAVCRNIQSQSINHCISRNALFAAYPEVLHYGPSTKP
jgi:hypothetical protein